MRKYCVVLIAIIMLMPSGEIQASEATMVASLSIVEAPAAYTTTLIVPTSAGARTIEAAGVTSETQLAVRVDASVSVVRLDPGQMNIAIAAEEGVTELTMY